MEEVSLQVSQYRKFNNSSARSTFQRSQIIMRNYLSVNFRPDHSLSEYMQFSSIKTRPNAQFMVSFLPELYHRLVGNQKILMSVGGRSRN